MAVGQVVLYFEKQEDALQFTLAASSVISADQPEQEAIARVAQEISKASRIQTEGNTDLAKDPRAGRCA